MKNDRGTQKGRVCANENGFMQRSCSNKKVTLGLIPRRWIGPRESGTANHLKLRTESNPGFCVLTDSSQANREKSIARPFGYGYQIKRTPADDFEFLFIAASRKQELQSEAGFEKGGGASS